MNRASAPAAILVALLAAFGYGLLELAFFGQRNHLLPWKGEHVSLLLVFFALHAVVALAAWALAVFVGARIVPALARSLPYLAPSGALLLMHAVSYLRERKYSLPRDLVGSALTLAVIVSVVLAIGLAAALVRRNERAARFLGVAVAVAITIWGAGSVATVQPIGVRASVAPRSENDRLVASETGQRVFVLGLDGITWTVLDPLIASGRVPNLAALASRGRTFDLETIRPTFSPVIWTSVSTGKNRFQHGIHDVVQTILPGGTRLHRSILRTAFFTKTTGVPFRFLDSRRMLPLAPYRSTQVKATSVFEAASEAGLPATQIEWYVSWPAKPLSGMSISDRFHLQSPDALADPDTEPMPGVVYPGLAARPLLEHVVTAEDVPLERVLAFADVADLSPSQQRSWAAEHSEFVHEMRFNLARDLSTRNVAVDLLERDELLEPSRQWRLFGVYFRAVDLTHHLTWPLRDLAALAAAGPHPGSPGPATGTTPGSPGATDRSPLAPVIARYYEFVDGIVGELLSRVPEDAVVIALSDHGFEDRFAHRRAPHGFAIVAGGATRSEGGRGVLSIFDVAPTVAALLGIPVAEDLERAPREDLLDPAFLELHPPRRVPTWDWQGRSAIPEDALTNQQLEEAEIERLKALGYL